MQPDLIERFERSPCAHQTELVSETGERLEDALQDLWPGATVDIGETRACFIPTFSAVIGVSNAETGTRVGVSRFDQVIGDSSNDEHLETSPTMDRAIRGAIESLFPPVINPAAPGWSTAIDGPDMNPFDPAPAEPSPTPFDPTEPDPTPNEPVSDDPIPAPNNPVTDNPVADAPAPPANFEVTVYSSSAIGIDWDKVDGATRYVLRRDGNVLYDSNGNGYWDDGLEAGRTYRYSLVAHHGDERSTELTIDRATNG